LDFSIITLNVALLCTFWSNRLTFVGVA